MEALYDDHVVFPTYTTEKSDTDLMPYYQYPDVATYNIISVLCSYHAEFSLTR